MIRLLVCLSLCALVSICENHCDGGGGGGGGQCCLISTLRTPQHTTQQQHHHLSIECIVKPSVAVVVAVWQALFAGGRREEVFVRYAKNSSHHYVLTDVQGSSSSSINDALEAVVRGDRKQAPAEREGERGGLIASSALAGFIMPGLAT